MVKMFTAKQSLQITNIDPKETLKHQEERINRKRLICKCIFNVHVKREGQTLYLQIYEASSILRPEGNFDLFTMSFPFRCLSGTPHTTPRIPPFI